MSPTHIGSELSCFAVSGSVTVPDTRTVPELGHRDYRDLLDTHAMLAQFNTEQTGCCKTTPRPFSSQTDGTV